MTVSLHSQLRARVVSFSVACIAILSGVTYGQSAFTSETAPPPGASGFTSSPGQTGSANKVLPWGIDRYHEGSHRWSIFERFTTREEADEALKKMRRGAEELNWEPPKARVVPSNIRELEQLGGLSAKHESRKGPSEVSPGMGDPGGPSYGTYQLKSRATDPSKAPAKLFVDRFYPNRFQDLVPGTPQFSAEWKRLAKEHKEELASNEHLFIAETHYLPHVEKLKAETGIDLGNRSKALREVVWSISVQHPLRTKLYKTAINPLSRSQSLSELTDREIIQALYKERSRTNADGILVHFIGTKSPEWQKNLKDRFVKEEKQALKMLAEEKED